MAEDAGRPPQVPYWHLWTDGGGVSHQTRCMLTRYELHGVGDAAPQWNDKQTTVGRDRRVHRPAGRLGRGLAREPGAAVDRRAVRPVGGSRAWDGTRIEQSAGEFSFGEDQGCTSADGRRGHRSGTVGNQPAVLMTVQVHVPPIRRPCHIA